MNGQQLLIISEAGLLLSSDESEQGKKDLLVVLLDIEDALDKGRILATDSDLLPKINKKMDEFRRKVRDIMDEMDKDVVRNLLEDRGESLRHQFSLN